MPDGISPRVATLSVVRRPTRHREENRHPSRQAVHGIRESAITGAAPRRDGDRDAVMRNLSLDAPEIMRGRAVRHRYDRDIQNAVRSSVCLTRFGAGRRRHPIRSSFISPRTTFAKSESKKGIQERFPEHNLRAAEARALSRPTGCASPGVPSGFGAGELAIYKTASRVHFLSLLRKRTRNTV